MDIQTNIYKDKIEADYISEEDEYIILKKAGMIKNRLLIFGIGTIYVTLLIGSLFFF